MSFIKSYGIYIFFAWVLLALGSFFFGGGYSLPVSLSYYIVLLLGFISITQRLFIKEGLFDKNLLIIILLSFFYSVFVSVLQVIVFGDYVDSVSNRSVSDFLASIWLVMITSFVIGCAAANIEIKINRWVYIFILILVFFAWTEVVSEGLLIDWVSINSNRPTGVYASHLALELPLIIFLLFMVSLANGFYRTIVFLFAVFVLWSFSGRTLLLSFVISYVITSGTSFKNKVLALMSVLLCAGLFFFYIVDISDNVFISRMLFSDGLSGDISAHARGLFFDFALHTFENYLLIGNVSFYAQEFGDVGAYVHNILSAVQIYGFVFLFAVLLVLALVYKKLFSMRLYGAASKELFFAFNVINISTVGLIFGKYVGTPLLWFAIGYSFLLRQGSR